jgi:hypothetical protein
MAKKKISDMSVEELRKLADEKERKENTVTVAEATIKNDIYSFETRDFKIVDINGYTYKINNNESEVFSEKEIMEACKSAMNLLCPKGTKIQLVGYREYNDWYYTWYDKDGNIEWSDTVRVRDQIENIKILDKKHAYDHELF